MNSPDRKGKAVMQDDDDVLISNLVPGFLGDAVQIGRARERRRKAGEEAAAAAAEGSSSWVHPDCETPSLADKSDESSGYCNNIREDDPDTNFEVDPNEAVIPDHVRIEGLPQKVEMPWRTPVGSLVANGRSWVDEGINAAIRLRCLTPDAVKIRIPSVRQRPADAPPGWFCVYECFFTEFGVRFSIFPLLLEYAFERGVAQSQLTHCVIRHIVFTGALAKHTRIIFDRVLFERVTDLRADAKEGDFKSFHTTMKHNIVYGDHRDKIHNWAHYYFYVKINSASIGDFYPDQILTGWVHEAGRSLIGFVST